MFVARGDETVTKSKPRKKDLCGTCQLGGEEKGPIWSKKSEARVQGLFMTSGKSGNLGDGKREYSELHSALHHPHPTPTPDIATLQ